MEMCLRISVGTLGVGAHAFVFVFMLHPIFIC